MKLGIITNPDEFPLVALSRKSLDHTNRQYARLTALRPVGSINNHKVWLCQCSCGNYALAGSDGLVKGIAKSCGCLTRERLGYVQKGPNDTEINSDGSVSVLFHNSNGNTIDKVVIDAEDIGVLAWRWAVQKQGYARSTSQFCPHRNLHRFIAANMGLVVGEDQLVDHIDQNPRNNRRNNLRLASYGENAANSKTRGSSSGYRGVSRDHSIWTALITHDGVMYRLGRFRSKHDAAEAYNEAAARLLGDFAQLNVIDRSVPGEIERPAKAGKREKQHRNCRNITVTDPGDFPSVPLVSGSLDLAGKKLGKLTAIRCIGKVGISNLWLLRCECGNHVSLTVKQIGGRKQYSCGCARHEYASSLHTKGPNRYTVTDDGVVVVELTSHTGDVVAYTTIDVIDIGLLDRRWAAKEGEYVCTNGMPGVIRRQKLHRAVAAEMGIDLSTGTEIDHIDGNKLNNRRSNLRAASRAENTRNRTTTIASSGYKGVWKKSKGWIAGITCGGRRHDLGKFDTPEEAAKAYNEAALRLFGEYAHLNEIRGAS